MYLTESGLITIWKFSFGGILDAGSRAGMFAEYITSDESSV
jgi:hypothetical protein